MSASDKIKAVLRLKGLKQKDLAAYLGMTQQSLVNKFKRGSFSINDLVKIAELTGAPLGFEIGSGSRVTFDKDDIRPIE